ncbi:MAG: HAD family hydrolase [Nanoarchaeota archaeon]|nr:HAD family hydrolase [Nanoarchaeota archaeon]
MKRKIKAVLFDIDGSLIDSQLALYYLFKDSLIVFEEKQKSKNEIIKQMGSTTIMWIKNLVPNISKNELDDMRKWIRYKYAKHYMTRFAKPMKYAKYVLTTLRKNGIKIGIVTNQHQNQENVSVKIIKFNKFDVVITSDDVKKSKPHPEGILLAIKKLKVKKDEVIYIGDTKSDVEASKMAGIKVFLVKHSYNRKIKCNKISNLKEVLRLVS